MQCKAINCADKIANKQAIKNVRNDELISLIVGEEIPSFVPQTSNLSVTFNDEQLWQFNFMADSVQMAATIP